MSPVPRSGYETVGALVFFGRTLDKIRLHAAGQLPPDYNLGVGIDGRILRFLRIEYPVLVTRTLEGGSDEEILEWCYANGRRPSEEEIEIFNGFITKLGWRDNLTAKTAEDKEKMGVSDRDEIQTRLDVHDADEGRPPRFAKP